MGTNTAIEWADHTWNLVRGCVEVEGSPACDHCYAKAMAKRNPKALGVWGSDGTRVFAADAYLELPRKWNDAAAKRGVRDTVFAYSLADWAEDWTGPILNTKGEKLATFGGGFRPALKGDDFCLATMDDVRRALFATIDATPNLIWLLLTKRPQNIARFWVTKCGKCSSSPTTEADCSTCGGRPNWRHNVWLGTTVEDQTHADERIPHLLKRRNLCAGTFLSMEPLLSPVDLEAFLSVYDRDGEPSGPRCFRDGSNLLGWIIAGGESGHHARLSHPLWYRSLRDQAIEAGVPFFFKQWGDWGADAIDLRTGEPVIREFATHTQWVNKASTWVNGGTCVDTAGNVLTNGRDFRAADEGGRFPVAILHRVGKHAAGHVLDGQVWQQFPAAFGKETVTV